MPCRQPVSKPKGIMICLCISYIHRRSQLLLLIIKALQQIFCIQIKIDLRLQNTLANLRLINNIQLQRNRKERVLNRIIVTSKKTMNNWKSPHTIALMTNSKEKTRKKIQNHLHSSKFLQRNIKIIMNRKQISLIILVKTAGERKIISKFKKKRIQLRYRYTRHSSAYF